MSVVPASTLPESKTGYANWLGAKQFALLLLFLIVLAFPDVLFGGKTFFYRDFGIFGYPLAFHHRESFWRGEIPLWNPYSSAGLPFLAQWNTLVFYPLSLIYLLLPLPWSLSFFCLVHLFVGGLGMYCLAFAWTQSRLGACVAGISFAFGGLALSCLKWPNNIAALAWMPWVVLLMESGVTAGGRRLLLACIVGAIQMLSGAPEIILFTWLIVVVFVLRLAWVVKTSSETTRIVAMNERRHVAPIGNRLYRRLPTCGTADYQSALHQTSGSWRGGERNETVGQIPGLNLGVLLCRFALAGAAVAGLAAVQLLPFLDLLRHSQRDMGFADSSWSLPLWGWANFLVPLFHCFPSYQGVFAQFGQYWISSYYVGVGGVLLALMALRGFRQPRILFLALLTLVSLMLSFGSAGIFYDWIAGILPIVRIVRFPVKLVVVAIFALPILAAMGVRSICLEQDYGDTSASQEAIGWSFPQRMFVCVCAGLLVLISGIVWYGGMHPLPSDDANALWKSGVSRAGFLILTAGALIGVARFHLIRRQRVASIFVLGLVWLDLMSHAPRLSPTIERWVLEKDLARNELKLSPEPGLGGYRAMVTPYADYRLNHAAFTNAVDDYLFSRLSLFANVNLLDAIPKVDGFFSLYTKPQSEIRSLLYGFTNAFYPKIETFLGVAQRTAQNSLIQWEARTNGLPLVTGGQIPVFWGSTNVMGQLADPGFDPTRKVFLPEASAGKTVVRESSEVAVRSGQFGPHEVGITIDAERPAWIVVAQTAYHPWKLYLNGIQSSWFPANLAFQAFEVPAGITRARLVYEDPAFRVGAVVSVTTLLILIWGWYRTKRAQGIPDLC